MEAQYAVHPASLSVQAPCYLYEHELDQHQRQLVSQMSTFPSSMPMYAAQPQQNQQEHQQQQQSIYPPLAPKGGFEAMHANQIASSQATGLKPTIVVQHESQSVLSLDTRFANADFYQFPSTPPLSTSGSTISSPPSSCGMVQTPMDGSFFSIEKLDGAKEGCDAGVNPESLAKPDWARSDSPPLTPVFVHPPSVTASQPTDLLSTNSSCPSLSPSPSPVSSSGFSADQPVSSDFCDPRQLTVDPSTQKAPEDIPPLPILGSGDDEEHKSLLNDGSISLSTQADAQPTSLTGAAEATLTTLPAFDSLSDLDSDDDPAKRMSDVASQSSVFYLGDKRQRVGSLYGLEEDGFLSEQSFEDLDDEDAAARSGLPTINPQDLLRNDEGDHDEAKRVSFYPTMPDANSDVEGSDSRDLMLMNCDDESQPMVTDDIVNTEANAVPENVPALQNAAPARMSNSRRGRKQSVTDDPSKTFVCTLCSRRFRRQEHLKRHYRSLHTQDKPFECNECGKRFSRSDNLSQHARTHGTSSIVLGVMSQSDVARSGHSYGQDSRVLGAFYGPARAAIQPRRESMGADVVGSPKRRSLKKRKRDESV